MLPKLKRNSPTLPKINVLRYPSPTLLNYPTDYHSSQSPILRKFYKYSALELKEARNKRLSSLKAGRRELEEWKKEVQHKKFVSALVQRNCRVSISLLETHSMSPEQLVEVGNERRQSKLVKEAGNTLKKQAQKKKVRRIIQEKKMREHMAAFRIQKRWKLYKVNKQAEEEVGRREAAAIKIQKVYRGYRCRGDRDRAKTGALKKDLYNKLDRNYDYFTNMKRTLQERSALLIAKQWLRYKDERKRARGLLKHELLGGFKRRMGIFLRKGIDDAKIQKKNRKGFYGLRKGLAQLNEKPKAGSFYKSLVKPH